MVKMDVKEIENILINEVSAILAADIDAVGADVTLQDLGVDSLGFVELLVAIEKRFNLKLIESGLTQEDFRTIGSLAKRIDREGVE